MQNESLKRAFEISARVAAVGFDWEHASEALDKVLEEGRELHEVLDDRTRATDELGDLLFSVVNVARKLGIDPHSALAGTCDKFERRFAYIEATLARCGKTPEESNLEEMDALWNEAKAAERDSGRSG